MDCNNKIRPKGCNCFGIIFSIIVGIAIGILFSLEYIPFTSTVLWILFGLTALVLGFLLISALVSGNNSCSRLMKCLCSDSVCLFIGVIGAFISLIIALSITIVATNTFAIIIIGLIAFFLTLMILGLIGFISCISDCK